MSHLIFSGCSRVLILVMLNCKIQISNSVWTAIFELVPYRSLFTEIFARNYISRATSNFYFSKATNSYTSSAVQRLFFHWSSKAPNKFKAEQPCFQVIYISCSTETIHLYKFAPAKCCKPVMKFCIISIIIQGDGFFIGAGSSEGHSLQIDHLHIFFHI